MTNYPLPPGASWYPQYLPYPQAIPAVSNYPVPNRTAIDWPQAQWAPRYLPPGSKSFQDFNWGVGAETKVLYGAGNPMQTQTPRGEYAGDDGGCGCGGSAYGGDCECDGKKVWSPWAYLALGAGIGLLMKHLLEAARNEVADY